MWFQWKKGRFFYSEVQGVDTRPESQDVDLVQSLSNSTRQLAHYVVRMELLVGELAFAFVLFAGLKWARFSGKHEYGMSMYVYSKVDSRL